MRKVYAIAHRGFSAAAPENTLAAFEKAIDLESDMMECDVRRTRDGRLVVIHDATVDRTTNGSGAVADIPFAEIRKLDAGSWFAPEFAGRRIPTLEEVLDLSKGRIRLIIEIKEEHTEEQAICMVQERGMSEEVLLTSFFYSVGMRLPALDERIPFQPLKWIDGKPKEDEAVRLADEAAAVNGLIFGVNYRAITPDLVRTTHAANMRMMAWTVDREEEMRSLVEMGVDAIASNQLALLLSALSDMGVR